MSVSSLSIISVPLFFPSLCLLLYVCCFSLISFRFAFRFSIFSRCFRLCLCAPPKQMLSATTYCPAKISAGGWELCESVLRLKCPSFNDLVLLSRHRMVCGVYLLLTNQNFLLYFSFCCLRRCCLFVSVLNASQIKRWSFGNPRLVAACSHVSTCTVLIRRCKRNIQNQKYHKRKI